MAESVYATPPSPDLSDEDLAMHHPVVILDEHTGANEAGDDQALATPGSGNGPLGDASPAAHNQTAANSHPEEPDAENGSVELPQNAATSAAFPSYPHHDDQPPENGESPAPPATSKEPATDHCQSPEPTANLFSHQSGNNQFALPFADFAAHLLKASNGGQRPQLPQFEDNSSTKAKKGRKQTAPNRLSDDTVLNPAAAAAAAAMNLSQFQTTAEDDSAEALARRQFLAEFTQKLAAIVEQQDGGGSRHSGDEDGSADEDGENSDTASLENGELEKTGNSHQPGLGHFDVSGDFQCTMCPARFDSQLKYGMHMLQIHGAGGGGNLPATPAMDPAQFQIRVKKEMHWDPDSDAGQQQQQHHRSESDRPNMSGMPGLPHDNWLPMAGASSIPFPFSPEAAAMLSASGYLSQMPQLLAGQMSGFGATGPDGMPRPNIPPIRIFNPEAYCDLCNKEFCNKYFLKTHKANKHNIYEPSTSGSQSTATTSSSSSAAGMGDNHQSSGSGQHSQQQQLNQMSQFYMQQQQQQHHHQMQMSQQHQQQQQQMHEQHQMAMQAAAQPPPVDTTVPCDVCQRRFSNAASMRRHRAKAHESHPVAANNSSSGLADAKLEQKAETTATGKFQLPDGFREDFTVEQEDTSFTPQIRKLSPASSQLARDSNFSNDKLRRLGVINPEAFCEICCKEYCNKYFLRTHKIKRHGIYMPADDQQHQQQQQHQHQLQAQQQPSAAAAALLSGFLAKDDANKWLQFVQNTPLNLMMGVQQELSLAGKRSNEQLADNDEDSAAGDHRAPTSPNSKRAKFSADAGTANAADEPPSSEAAQQQAAQDAISVDLQKLQSMIMQLNDLSAQRPAPCSLCGKQFDNQYVLHAHMLAEHAPPGDNNNDGLQAAIKSSPPSSPTPGTAQQQLHFPSSAFPTTKSDFQCKQCDKEFASELALRHHHFESHGLPQFNSGAAAAISPPALALHHFAKKMAADVFGSGAGAGAAGTGGQAGTSGGSGNSASGGGERRPYTMTPTSSYCEICNKELCNKYFMKTHMQRMHGIEIENGAQIGGVICNICNKELCSKYFLRVHKHNTHGIVEEGSPLPVPRGSSGASAAGQGSANSAVVDLASAESTGAGGMMELKSVGMAGSPTANNGPIDVKPGEVVATVMGNGQRYYANYSEVCPLCSRRFRGSKWLRSHLMSDHGKMGMEKLRELEHSASMAKQQQQQQRDSSPPTLRIPGGSAGAGAAFGMADMAMNLNKRSVPAKMQHKHDISSLFGPTTSQLDDSPMSLATGGKLSKYSCNYCPFTSTSYAFLFIHERSHTLQAMNGDSESATTLAKSEASTPGVDQQMLQFPSAHNRSSSMLPFGVSFPSLTASPPSQMVSPTATQSAEADAPHPQSPPPTRNGQATATPPTLQTPPLPAATSPTRRPATQQAHSMPADTHAILNDMANSAKLPAAYALPAHSQHGSGPGSESPPLVMQSFLMEEQHDAEGGEDRDRQRRFVPSIVYLPVKQRFPDKLVVSFTLTPA